VVSSLEICRGAGGNVTSISVRFTLSDFGRFLAFSSMALILGALFEAFPSHTHLVRRDPGLYLLVLGGIFFVGAIHRMVWSPVRLIANQDGLIVPGCGKVDWHEVIEFRIASGGVGWELWVDLKNADALRRKSGKGAATPSFGRLAAERGVDMAVLKAALEELMGPRRSC